MKLNNFEKGIRTDTQLSLDHYAKVSNLNVISFWMVLYRLTDCSLFYSQLGCCTRLETESCFSLLPSEPFRPTHPSYYPKQPSTNYRINIILPYTGVKL